MSQPQLYTIGHSNRTIDEFLDLLSEFDVNAIADVRSSPFSRRNPQFNRKELNDSLKSRGMVYVFLGSELGARREERECYENGVARYEKIAKIELFRKGLERIRKGSLTHRIAMMCAEKDPLTCHRTILVCRLLKARLSIGHIIEHERIESHQQAEDRLLRLYDLDNRKLLSREELLEDAYEKQGNKIAYRERNTSSPGE